MTDVYVSGPVQADLETFANNFTNHIPATAGTAATAEIPATYAADGVTVLTPDIPAQPAKGDPALFYTLIRASFDITPIVQEPFAVVDPSVGMAVCGVFA